MFFRAPVACVAGGFVGERRERRSCEGSGDEVLHFFPRPHSPRGFAARARSPTKPPATQAKHHGPVVQKPVNANLGLKFNQGSCFSCLKVFSQQIPSGSLKATKVKV